jgi:hypothetical protein
MSASWLDYPITFVLSALIAFSIGSLVIALDCWRQNSSEFLYSTYPVFGDPWGVLFCVAFGLIAAGAFVYVQYDPHSWLADAITLKVENPLARGALVGISVMIIVRSKVLQLSKDAGDFGLEFIYLRGREIVLRRLRRRRANEKLDFIRGYLPRMMRIESYPEELDQRMTDLLATEIKRLEVYGRQRDSTTTPNKPFATDDALWMQYYRTLTRNAVDFVGIRAVKEWLDSLLRH